MKKLFSIFAALLFAGSMMAASITVAHTSSTTTNMDGSNQAALFSDGTNALSASVWSFVGQKNDASNNVGLNKDKTTRLYCSGANSGTNGSALVVTLTGGTIQSVSVDIKSGTTLKVLVGGSEVAIDGGLYSVGSTSFTLQNVAAKGAAQVQLNSITINYKMDGDVDVDATAIELNKSSFTLEQYREATLDATLTPSNATTIVAWNSSDETVATVSGGLVKAIAPGTATITATAGEGVSASCTVYVTTATVLTCEQAAALAATLSANNEKYPGGQYVVEGYAISMNTSNGYIWLADDKDASKGTFEIYLPSNKSEIADVVKGDKIRAHGYISKYNTTYEFLAGCVFEVIADVPEVAYYLKNNWEAGEWVWKEMTKVNDDQYKLENVVFGGTGVNWNTAESDEGASWVALEAFEGDIIKALDTVNLILTPSTGAIYATLLGSYIPPVDNIYTAAGSSAAIFGTAWDPTVADNDLALKEGSIYEKVYTDVTLAAGTVSFKVCVNHDWNPSYPADNYNLTISEDGIYTITITFDASTSTVSATAEKTGSAVVIPVIELKGSWNAAGAYDATWNGGAAYTFVESGAVATYTVNFTETGTYELGLQVNGAWTANGATITRTAPGTDLDNGGTGNMHLVVDVVGEYEFIWTYAVNNLTVMFPDEPVVGCDWDNIEFFNVGIGDTDENYNQFKICKEGENPNFVNIQIAPWANNNKGIYINFPTAEIGTVSLPADQYKIEGAGMLLFLSAFSAKETDVTIQFQGTDCNFTVYNAKGEEVPTAIENNEIIEKAVKFIENGQLFIRKNGKTYNAQGAIVE